ncbi:CoA-disulfide reductase [Lentibacillus sp. L22]|uniref:CoA-disulfide reductase n=1 Tax=Lentibacillus TaxID=175304 RepID=UPI0022B0C768|nr:CoA-disulfide reductase [Lentibacillus daqui]
MLKQKIVIVGGVGGGSTVASQIRRLNQEAEITLLEQNGHIAFSNCGMPYYLGGVIHERDAILTDAEKFAKKYKVDVQLHTMVTNIDRDNQTVAYQHESAIGEVSYDILILSPGASAIVPPIDGINRDNTFTLRTIPDMDRINAYIQQQNPQTCVIVGGGFVGLEMVENLTARGIDCTIVDRSNHLLHILDEDMAGLVHRHVREHGIELKLKQSAESFTSDGKTLHLDNGDTLSTDMTLLSVGIKPNIELAENAGLELGETGAIAVNDVMQTSDPKIYALGDVVETRDFLTKQPRNVALASPAHRQAFIIANHLYGQKVPYQGTVGSAILRVFDLTVGSTGNTSESLQDAGIAFQTVTQGALSNAGYFPGAEKISLKILFDPENGQLLGGQVIGKKGVDKRLAVMATAINGRLTVADLTELELAYAPPYASPKDPINTVGYKALAQME